MTGVTEVIEVLDPGPLATVQDLGRPGLAHLGVPPSGAADAAALRLANRLVGNPEEAAGLEVTAGGTALLLHAPATVAAAGAPCPLSAGAPVPFGAAARLPAGARLRLGRPSGGLRTYLAVRGGLDVPAVLGSRSTDLLTGLGPAPLAGGDRLPVGPEPATRVPAAGDVPVSVPGAETLLEVLAGPRDGPLGGPAAVRWLTGGCFRVSHRSDRVAVRLDGPPLPGAAGVTVEPEGLVTGAVQVPPDGRPLVFLTDHPVTGGYPVLAVLTDRSLGPAAQLIPGGVVRFRAAAPG